MSLYIHSARREPVARAHSKVMPLPRHLQHQTADERLLDATTHWRGRSAGQRAQHITNYAYDGCGVQA